VPICSQETFIFRYPFAPIDVVEFFKQNYGPTTRAFANLGVIDQASLRKEFVELWTSNNKADCTAHTVVDAEYLEVVAVIPRTLQLGY
jgi:hypothetical protein